MASDPRSPTLEDETSPASQDEIEDEPSLGRRYMAALALGALSAFVCLVLGLSLLKQSGNLPAPAISNSGCIDEKLGFMRDHTRPSPNLLVLGSSVAWRHFDSALLAERVPGSEPFNGAFCGLSMNQSSATAGWLLARMPSVERAVLIVAPQDFERCAAVPPAFDVRDADRFVFEHAWLWGFYLRYFDPVSLVRNALHKVADRKHDVPLDSRALTRYGDGPLDTATSRELTYGPLFGFDPTCFAALHDLAQDFERAGRTLWVVQTPLHPEWKARYDPSATQLDWFHVEVEHALANTGARYWSAERELQFARAAFTDAIHLRWSAARELTAAIARQLAPEP